MNIDHNVLKENASKLDKQMRRQNGEEEPQEWEKRGQLDPPIPRSNFPRPHLKGHAIKGPMPLSDIKRETASAVD